MPLGASQAASSRWRRDDAHLPRSLIHREGKCQRNNPTNAPHPIWTGGETVAAAPYRSRAKGGRRKERREVQYIGMSLPRAPPDAAYGRRYISALTDRAHGIGVEQQDSDPWVPPVTGDRQVEWKSNVGQWGPWLRKRTVARRRRTTRSNATKRRGLCGRPWEWIWEENASDGPQPSPPSTDRRRTVSSTSRPPDIPSSHPPEIPPSRPPALPSSQSSSRLPTSHTPELPPALPTSRAPSCPPELPSSHPPDIPPSDVPSYLPPVLPTSLPPSRHPNLPTTRAPSQPPDLSCLRPPDLPSSPPTSRPPAGPPSRRPALPSFLTSHPTPKKQIGTFFALRLALDACVI